MAAGASIAWRRRKGRCAARFAGGCANNSSTRRRAARPSATACSGSRCIITTPSRSVTACACSSPGVGRDDRGDRRAGRGRVHAARPGRGAGNAPLDRRAGTTGRRPRRARAGAASRPARPLSRHCRSGRPPGGDLHQQGGPRCIRRGSMAFGDLSRRSAIPWCSRVRQRTMAWMRCASISPVASRPFSARRASGSRACLNVLLPGVNERISGVSGSTGKGRHTTTGTRLFPLGGTQGGYIADTAGIRSLTLQKETLRHLDTLLPGVSSLSSANAPSVIAPTCMNRSARSAMRLGWGRLAAGATPAIPVFSAAKGIRRMRAARDVPYLWWSGIAERKSGE